MGSDISNGSVLHISERRVHLTQSWKEEVFGFLDHALIMCETMDPNTSRPVKLAYAGALKGKYERYNHKSEN